MKKTTVLVFLFAGVCGLLAACSHRNSRSRTAKKIYITQEDYLEDARGAAELERREAQPNYESDYLFNAYPQTDPNVYFFDKRQQPKLPGEFSAKEYKSEKRLWTKPKRYTPEENYGRQGDAGSANTTTTEESGYYETSEGY